MKKKILLCAYSLDTGGSEKMLFETISNIKDIDFEILLVKPGGAFYDKVPKNIKIHSIIKNNSPKIFHKLKIVSLLFFSNLFLKKFNNKFDSIIAFDCFFGSLLTDTINSTEKIYWIHTNISDALYNRKNILLNIFLPLKKLEIFYNNATKIICICNQSTNDFLSTFPNLKNPKKVVTVVNPLNIENIVQLSKEPIEEDLSGNSIVCCGRLSFAKGQEILISSLYDLKKKNIPFKAYFIGTGKEMTKLTQLIKTLKLENEVFLLGHKTNPYPYIKKAKIVVIPSIYESYCLVAAESIVLNKVIIATKTIGVTEVLKDGEIGILTEKEGLTDNIYKVLTDSTLYSQLVKSTQQQDHISKTFNQLKSEFF